MQGRGKQLFTTVACALLAVGGGFLVVRRLRSPAEQAAPRLGGGSSSPSSSPAVRSPPRYSVEVTSGAERILPATDTTIAYRIMNDRGETVKGFSIAHEKLMHLIVVRKDLQHFQHLHPTFEAATGTSSIEMTFLADGPYRLFADFTPSIEDPQRLPVTAFVDVVAGEENTYVPQPVVPDTEHEQSIGAYRVTYEFPGTLKAQTPFTYSMSIAKNGEPVTNLEPYLGALGHSVLLKTDTLDFVHTHAEEQEGRTRGPLVLFSTTFSEPGLYKAFSQFQHEGRVLTAEHVVSVERGSGAAKSPEHGGEHPMQ